MLYTKQPWTIELRLLLYLSLLMNRLVKAKRARVEKYIFADP